jgi:hypothetical protein
MRITTSIAKKLVNNYKQNHWAIINNSPDFTNIQDSRSVWFDIGYLRKFLSELPEETDGIRIYFGEYSDDVIQEILQNPDLAQAIPNISQYSGLHTLVMIPTMPDVDGVSYDFNMTDPNCNPDFSNPHGLIAENHGTLQPPPFSSNTASTALEVLNGQEFLAFCDQNP